MRFYEDLLHRFLVVSVCFFVSCKDNPRASVRVEANKIHDRIKMGDFGKIYEDASPRIRECYSQDSFSEKMGSLAQNLKVVDSQLNFREVNGETEKFDLIGSLSDMFAEGLYTVGPEGNGLREYLVFKNEDNKLKFFAYRVFNASEKKPDVRSSMIACAQTN
jgi:hypothetical protein